MVMDDTEQRDSFVKQKISHMSRVFVIGTGVVPFHAPSKTSPPYYAMGSAAIQAALSDAAITPDGIHLAVVGHVYGDSTTGQRCITAAGVHSVGVINCNNNCSTGSTALMTARQMLRSGAYGCVLVLGVEQMQRGGLTVAFPDRAAPTAPHWDAMWALGAPKDVTVLGGAANEITENVLRLFGEAQLEHKHTSGSSVDHLVAVAHKNLTHGQHNPNAMLRATPHKATPEAIRRSHHAYGDIRQLMACGIANGAAAAVLCSEAFLAQHPRHESRAVEIVGQAMTTDTEATFAAGTYRGISGYDLAVRASAAALREANVTASDVDIVELHDCYASNEMMMYEALGFASKGRGHEMVETFRWVSNAAGTMMCHATGDLTMRSVVVNPSGGLITKGHPLGATGVAQCDEIVRQLRGEAGPRQVDGAKVGLQHNYGIGSACVVTVYRRSAVSNRSKM